MDNERESTAEPTSQVDAIKRAIRATQRVVRGAQLQNASSQQRPPDVPLKKP